MSVVTNLKGDDLPVFILPSWLSSFLGDWLIRVGHCDKCSDDFRKLFLRVRDHLFECGFLVHVVFKASHWYNIRPAVFA